jgi:hypothetical protein
MSKNLNCSPQFLHLDITYFSLVLETFNIHYITVKDMGSV